MLQRWYFDYSTCIMSINFGYVLKLYRDHFRLLRIRVKAGRWYFNNNHFLDVFWNHGLLFFIVFCLFSWPPKKLWWLFQWSYSGSFFVDLKILLESCQRLKGKLTKVKKKRHYGLCTFDDNRQFIKITSCIIKFYCIGY